nr:unnamed protein product [Callosobruchus chinensis]
MSKGYLMFSDDTPGLTMLKDEPDDLTHLAPVAGDVCVPLDDHPFLADMLDDILLKDNLAPLLADEPTDPFIAYRDQEPSPQLLSPNMSKTSDSLPSLGSPSDSLLDEDQMSTFMNLQMDDETGDMTLRAPYIPMDIADDLPLLMSNDLMWSSNEKKQLPDNNSSLAQLLSSSMNKHGLKANDHGGGGGGLVIPEEDLDRMFGDKNDKSKSWTSQNNLKNTSLNNQRCERSQNIKRSSPSTYDTQSKRPKNEPKEKMSSELLQQLMSNNHHRGRPKGKSNWLLDSGGQKAACISQPSDSVLMNLLDPPFSSAMRKPRVTPGEILMRQKKKRKLELERDKRNVMRKNSLSLLEPEANCLASFMDLTQHDYEVNAPVNDYLLQGEELLTALDINTAI